MMIEINSTEKDKKRKYNRRIFNIERGAFISFLSLKDSDFDSYERGG